MMHPLTAAALSLLFLPPLAHAEKPAWPGDLEQARKDARRTGKPIFVVFRCEH